MTREYIKTDKNGTRYYKELRTCDRCGNIAGGLYIVGVNNGEMVPSGVDNGVCWKCGGAGKVWEIVKEYTPEHMAKLEKARAKRAAKAAAENAAREAEIEAERKEREEREAAEKAVRLAEYQKKVDDAARSHYVGTVGEKIEFTAIVKRSFSYERPSYYGYGTELCFVHEFVDENGNVFVWYSTASIEAREGDTVKVRGTIKKHAEYTPKENVIFDEGNTRCYEDSKIVVKQTILTRCKVETIATPEPEEPQQEPEEINGAVYHMPYRQYKDHYADCKTVAGSYNENTHEIDVIIPEGRMKKSGVRGEHYAGYEMEWTDSTDGKTYKTCYRAIDADHAEKHLLRDYKTATNITFSRIYFY